MAAFRNPLQSESNASTPDVNNRCLPPIVDGGFARDGVRLGLGEGGCEKMVHFADALAWYSSPIVELSQVAEGTYRVRLASPDIARKCIPGQFVMVRVAGAVDPLIGRALAIFDRYSGADGSWEGIDVIFVAKGKFTSAVARMQVGQKLELWGPLGNGFSNEPVDHLILVAGVWGKLPC